MSDTQFPGMDPMGDTLKFMREMWAGIKMPGVSLPSLSLEDLDKQISDLKAVEGWLALNMHMLKATIQTLEVQRATLSALQAMGQNVGASMEQNMGKAVDAAMHAAGAMTGMNPMAQGPMAGVNPAGDKHGAQPSDSAASGADGRAFSFAAPEADKPEPPPAEDEAASPERAAGTDGQGGMPGMAAPFVDPAAWWGLLQDQFKQAMESATAGVVNAGESGAVQPARKKPSASPKPAGKAAKATKPGKSAAKQPVAKRSSKSAATSRKTRRSK